MKRKTMIATAAALALGGAIGVGALSYAPDAFAQAQAPNARLAHFQRMCSDGPARLAGMIAYAEVKLNLRAEQRPAWEQLTTAVRNAAQPLQRVCTQTTALPEPGDMLGRLDMGERFMTAGLEAIRTVRPALAQFQATLSPEQQATLRDLMRRGRGHWGHGRGFGGGPGGPGGHFGPPPGAPGTPPAPGGNAPPPARN
jgi:hypothetical protein